jgi:hypothetical protein
MRVSGVGKNVMIYYIECSAAYAGRWASPISVASAKPVRLRAGLGQDIDCAAWRPLDSIHSRSDPMRSDPTHGPLIRLQIRLGAESG